MIEIGDTVTLLEDDYYSSCKKGSIGKVSSVSIWYWRADVVFQNGKEANVHLDNLEKISISDGPGEEDGPWAPGWEERSGIKGD